MPPSTAALTVNSFERLGGQTFEDSVLQPSKTAHGAIMQKFACLDLMCNGQLRRVMFTVSETLSHAVYESYQIMSCMGRMLGCCSNMSIVVLLSPG